jgi:hypothetical protein
MFREETRLLLVLVMESDKIFILSLAILIMVLSLQDDLKVAKVIYEVNDREMKAIINEIILHHDVV